MKILPLNPLQTGLYNRLKAAITDVSIYDPGNVPENAPFPYITMGEPTARDDSIKSKTIWECTRTLHAWSAYKGHKEAQDILNRMVQALTDKAHPLTVTGFTVNDIDPEFAEVFEDEDDSIMHGVLRVRVTLQQT